MATAQISMVRVPGARLYCKARGSGPVLLMLAGGAAGADTFDTLAGHLDSSFTVIAYDRRGYTRSPLDDVSGASPIPIATQSDDARHVLAAFTDQPAQVFGVSMGGLVGLDLALRYPAQVRTLVAFEPPLLQVLGASEQPGDDVLDLSKGGDPEQVMMAFAKALGLDRQVSDSDPEVAERRKADGRFFLQREADGIGDYSVDVTELQASPARMIFAGGDEDRAFFPYLCAARAAELRGTSLVEFRGNHSGIKYPEETARKLRELLAAH
jgi:pimeloyl-ACP methyl ester carboxylesterase